MRCSVCSKNVDQQAYDQLASSDNLDNPFHADLPDDCGTVLCNVCKHFAVHIDCLPPNVDPKKWMCDVCYVCHHCYAFKVPKNEWNAQYRACKTCYSYIQDGSVICPVCEKLCRDGDDDSNLIQCDFCDQWIHAVQCGGLSVDAYAQLTKDSKRKYRCPLCEKAKKSKDAQRRRPKKESKPLVVAPPSAAKQVKSLKERAEEILSKVPPHDGSIAFYSVRKNQNEEGKTSKILSQLAVGSELCRCCCSSGSDLDMLMCSRCGDTYHSYCDDFLRGRPARQSRRKPFPFSHDATDSVWLCHGCSPLLSSRLPQPGASITNMEIDLPDDNGKFPILENAAPISNGCPRSSQPHLNNTSSGEKIVWKDERECEICGVREQSSGALGRLIPWASSQNSDVSHVWVHTSCAMWSCGVTIHGSMTHLDTLLGPRRSIISLAKHTRCKACTYVGATVKCAVPACRQYFHFECATKDWAICVVEPAEGYTGKRILEEGASKAGALPLAAIDGVQVYCKRCHGKNNAEDVRRLCMEITDVQRLINMDRLVRVVDRQGLMTSGGLNRLRGISMNRSVSMRVGSLAVIQFGRLVPEVDDYLMHDTLVPLGYCATRMFWSLAIANRRCTYFFEVGGTVQTGPVFVIRCSDAPQQTIEHSDPNVAWAQVQKEVMNLHPTWGRFDCMSGLEAFGLSKCKEIVNQVEALPLAGMFQGRYTKKCEHSPRTNDIVYYNPLARRYSPIELKKNESGCARTEGYMRRKNPGSSEAQERSRVALESMKCEDIIDIDGCDVSEYEDDGKDSTLVPVPPQYTNMRTGAAFQLSVIREEMCGDCASVPEHLRAGGTMEITVNQPGNGRNKRIPFPSSALGPADYSEAVVGGSQGTEGPIYMNGRGGRRGRLKRISKDPNDEHSSKKKRMKLFELEFAREAKRKTKILRSEIDGWGVFATCDIAAEELIIEYVGELIRPVVSDLREKKYDSMGIGCYMFEIVPGTIVDATLCGNAARYINHSCAPNCFSKTVMRGNRNIVAIYSKRRIQRGEELSYDYKFPLDDADRVRCGCGADQCRGFMN